MKLLKELLELSEAWVGDHSGTSHGKSRAGEQEWYSERKTQKQQGWTIEVRKGNRTIQLDKRYPTEEEAKKAIVQLRLPGNTAKAVPVYGNV